MKVWIEYRHVLTTVLVLSMAAAAHAGDPPCSFTRAAGNWSLTDNGTVVGIGPRAAVGTFKLDAEGNLLNGSAASSLNGAVATETFSGIYTVNDDCTGTIDVKIFDSATNTELFEVKLFTAFDDKMNELRGLFTSVVAPDGTPLHSVISLDARKQ